MKVINILNTLVSARQKEVVIRNMTITIAHSELLKHFPKFKMYKDDEDKKFLAIPVGFLLDDVDDYYIFSDSKVIGVIENAFNVTLEAETVTDGVNAYYFLPNKSYIPTGLEDCAIILYRKMVYVITEKQYREADGNKDSLSFYANYYEDMVLGMY